MALPISRRAFVIRKTRYGSVPMSPVPRRRDRHGNPIPRITVSHHPLPDGASCDQSALKDVLAQIATGNPALALTLRWLWDQFVCPMRRRAVAAQRQTEHRLKTRITAARRHNEFVTQKQAMLEARLTARGGYFQGLREAYAAEQHQRVLAAIHACAAIGRVFDPNVPGGLDPLAVARWPEPVLTAGLGLPSATREPADRLPTWLGWLVRGVMALVTGASIGLVLGGLRRETLTEEPWSVLPWIIPGSIPALCYVPLVRMATREFAERGALKRSWLVQIGPAVVAVAVPLVVISAEVLLSAQGLLDTGHWSRQAVGSGLSLPTPPASHLPAPLHLAVAAVLVLAYIAYAAFDGFFDARNSIVSGKAKFLQELLYRKELAQHLAQPGAEAAISAVAEARWARQRLEDLAVQEAAELKSLREAITELDRTRLAEDLEPSTRELHLGEDAVGDLEGAVRWYFRWLERGLQQVDRSERKRRSGWWCW